MSLLGEILADIAASLFAPDLSGLARYVTLPVLVIVWIVGVGLMVLAWRLGTGPGPTWTMGLAVILWILAPLAIMLSTLAWRDRRRGD